MICMVSIRQNFATRGKSPLGTARHDYRCLGVINNGLNHYERARSLYGLAAYNGRLHGNTFVNPGQQATADFALSVGRDAERDGIRVLHVDDEVQFLEMAATFLDREVDGIDVVTAESAERGLELLADGRFDAVISDYEMPATDGLEFLAAVREEYPDLPFVLYTGKGGEEIASEAIGKGVTDYLQKRRGSDQFTVLANRVVNAVDSYRAREAADWSRAHLESIAENVSDVVLTIDEDSVIQFVNPAVEEVFGYTPAALRGEPLTTLMPPNLREDHEASIANYLRTGERTLDWRGIELPGLTANGREIPLSISFGQFQQGDARYFTGIIREREP